MSFPPLKSFIAYSQWMEDGRPGVRNNALMISCFKRVSVTNHCHRMVATTVREAIFNIRVTKMAHSRVNSMLPYPVKVSIQSVVSKSGSRIS